MTRTSVAIITGLLMLAAGGGSQANTSNRSSGSEGAVRAVEYYPLAVGNWWQYTEAHRADRRNVRVRWKVTQRESSRGGDVYHIWRAPADGDEPLSLAETPVGIVEAGSDRVILKSILKAGERWAAESHSSRSVRTRDVFEVVSVGKPCSAGNHRFNDCATIREIDEPNTIASITTYARGVGPVKYVYFRDLDSTVVDVSLTVTSWHVK